jgi:hypothetical protein
MLLSFEIKTKNFMQMRAYIFTYFMISYNNIFAGMYALSELLFLWYFLSVFPDRLEIVDI